MFRDPCRAMFMRRLVITADFIPDSKFLAELMKEATPSFLGIILGSWTLKRTFVESIDTASS